MGFRAMLLRPFAQATAREIDRWSRVAVLEQGRIFHRLIVQGRETAFGRDHGFQDIHGYADFVRHTPLRDYEGLKPYVERIKQGELDVLWPGRPAYFAKTSGTTSGVKYIPITRASLPNHFGSARNAVFNYAARSGHYHWIEGKMIFLSGSPALEEVAGIPTGRLSGISNHLVPAWLKTNQLPSYATNCIEDWEEKLERIIDETLGERMTLISGIPPWVQMYYERLLARSGKSSVAELFPDYSLFVYGGVNFAPYRAKLEDLVGKKIASLETYPASEGFIAFQDRPDDPALLLNVASGIFFEFVPVAELGQPQPTRVWLPDVQLGVNYALIINSNAGLWGYNLGDTVQFVSLDPPRLVVTGRIKHFISAFGEHVIGKEVETAMQQACTELGAQVVEFTVAPQVSPPEGGLPYHEWLVEFATPPLDLAAFAVRLDALMRLQNIYYDDLIAGGILRPLELRLMPRDAFRQYMKAEGKLGGQNKTPRLANDRSIAERLLAPTQQ